MSRQLREECKLILIEAGKAVVEESLTQTEILNQRETKHVTVFDRVLKSCKPIRQPNEEKESLFEDTNNAWSYLVSEAEEFAHKENPDYILKERDESLGRDIIILKGLWWLGFKKRLGLHSPGRYRARIRLYVDEHTRWSNYSQNPLTMSVNKIEISDSGEVNNRSALVTESCPPTIWREIASGTYQGKHKVIADELSDNWYFFYLDPFEIRIEEELEFEFKDIWNTFKSGMKWDLIELFLLDTFHSSQLVFFHNFVPNHHHFND